MKQVIYVFLFFYLFMLGETGFSTIYQTPSTVESEYNSYPKITKLEKIILNRTYENDNLDSRLERLEKKTCSKTFQGADLAWRVDNITANIDQSELYNIPAKELASIEKQVLGRTYKKDTLDNRLSRLESQMLGARQSGKPDERYQTLLTASSHYNNFNQSQFDYNPMTSGSMGYTSGSGFKGAFQNAFGTLFGTGTMTGFTPPISPYGYSNPYGFNGMINPYSPYNNYYNNNRHNNFFNRCGSFLQNRPFINGHRPHHHSTHSHCCHNQFKPYRTYNPYTPNYATGWMNTNRNTQTGCGVHILD